MYYPNDNLGAAHRRLRHVISDELNADALARNNFIEPAQHDGTGQPLPPGHPSLPVRALTTNHAPGPVPEAQNLFDLLPRTRADLASGPNIVQENGSTIWNTDGNGGRQGDWPGHDQAQGARLGMLTPAWGRLPMYSPQSQLSNYVPAYQSPYAQPTALRYAPSLHPSQLPRVSSTALPAASIVHHGQPSLIPPIQSWRTDNLASKRGTGFTSPDTYADRVKEPAKKAPKPDTATRRKQEAFRQKAEALRRSLAALQSETPALVHRPLPTPGPSRPNASHPAKRRKITPAVVPETSPNTRPTTTTMTDRNPYDSTLSASMAPNHSQPQMAVHRPPVIELPIQSPDVLPQLIVGKYESYKWSVYHYELLPKGYDFAERWLEALFATTLQSPYQDRHVSHCTRGFIADGTRHSLIVLHNAANPFEYEPAPASTFTIGAYGYYWHHHNEIHWTTLGSDQRPLLAECVRAGFLTEKHKWTFDAAKATEKRFHRAYWLAANQRDLGALLNRGPSDDKPHDGVEEEDLDQEFSISEADLTNEWDVTDAEAAVAWQRVQDEVAALGDEFDVCGEGWQHVVTGSSEW